MQTLLDKLKKIQALAISGIDGERDNARRMLADLCKRHGISPGQLTSDKKTLIRFPIKDRLDGFLLAQVVSFVCQTCKVRNVREKKQYFFELTALQAIDVRACYAHYRSLWLKNLSITMQAFIHANNIMAPLEDDYVPQELTPDEKIEIYKIASMVGGMEKDPWKKHLQLSSASPTKNQEPRTQNQ